MLRINKEKLLEYGYSFETMEDLFSYIKEEIEWLESHNKNYNNKQYYRISDLRDICKCVEIGMTTEEKIKRIKEILNDRSNLADSEEFGLNYGQAINFLDDIEEVVNG